MARTGLLRTTAGAGPSAPRRSRSFITYLTATAGSYVGDGIRLAALPLLAASLTTSARGIAFVAAAAGLPWLVFGLVAGAFVDRTRRLPLMVLIQAARATIAALMAVGVLTGALHLWQLVVLAFLLGTGEVFYDIAAQSALPTVVPDDDLIRANGRLIVAEVTGVQLLGPAVGSLLFVTAAALPFTVDAASFATAAALIGLLAVRTADGRRPREAVTEASTTPSLGHEIGEGLRWFRRAPLVRSLTLTGAAVNAGAGGFYAVLVVFVARTLGLPGGLYGTVVALGSVGSLVGGLLAERRLTPAARRRVTLLAGPGIGICLALVAALPHPVVTVVLMSVWGLLAALFNVVAVSLRQVLVPQEIIGRVTAVHRLLCWGALPLGAAVAGLVADAAGARTAIACCAAVVVIGTAATAPTLRSTPDDAFAALDRADA
jgi:MFS family permease